MRPPFEVSNLQGDAVLCYAMTGAFAQPQLLLEHLEHIYFGFVRARERIRRNTSCDCCKACAGSGSLDLKLFLHHGSFVFQSIGGRKELSGPDVILVHRMMKNGVRDRTGWGAYLLMTRAAADAVRLRPQDLPTLPHRETFDVMGEVEMWALNLSPLWQAESQRKRTLVDVQDAWISMELELPVPPSQAWPYLTDPDQRRHWMRAETIAVVGSEHRVGVGTTMRCARGRELTDLSIVDWQPFDYLTEERVSSWFGRERWTIALEPNGNGTRVTWRLARPTAGGLWARMLQPVLKRGLTTRVADEQRILARLVATA